MVQDEPAMAFVTSAWKFFDRAGFFSAGRGIPDSAPADLVSVEPALPSYGGFLKSPVPDIRPEIISAEGGQDAFNAAKIFQSIFKQ
jgi:hypothetical protein